MPKSIFRQQPGQEIGAEDFVQVVPFGAASLVADDFFEEEAAVTPSTQRTFHGARLRRVILARH